MPDDGRAQLESRIVRGTRAIPAPLHPVPSTTADRPTTDSGTAGATTQTKRADTHDATAAEAATTAGPPAHEHEGRTIPPQGTIFSGPATHPLYIRVHPEISEWLERTVDDLRRSRTSRAEIVEMLLWEQRDAPDEHLADRLQAFRWQTGRR